MGLFSTQSNNLNRHLFFSADLLIWWGSSGPWNAPSPSGGGPLWLCWGSPSRSSAGPLCGRGSPINCWCPLLCCWSGSEQQEYREQQFISVLQYDANRKIPQSVVKFDLQYVFCMYCTVYMLTLCLKNMFSCLCQLWSTCKSCIFKWWILMSLLNVWLTAPTVQLTSSSFSVSLLTCPEVSLKENRNEQLQLHFHALSMRIFTVI